jgi:hypothetical protein
MTGLRPIVYMIGSAALEHGERGTELDADHPNACLCGFEDYMLCPRFDEGIGSWTIHPAAQGSQE